ncbi:MAG: DNA recombination protein RmuC [Casimicrobiaceae bacterium]|nr:DNA recombination protein RmuC [Casimicrobiaceae bacterium]MCX8099446.1 DNA recombination protein RmuC [Casimicrobiaceae bacterium]MDW8313113.1 DNA recombination protein RmuC [Burkholderiales bacterium]
MSLVEVLLAGVLALLGLVLLALLWGAGRLKRELLARLAEGLESKHRAITADVGLLMSQSSERLSRDLVQSSLSTQERVQRLQLDVVHHLSQQTEASLRQLAELQQALTARQDALRRDVLEGMLSRLAEQTRANQELLQNTLRSMASQLREQAEAMSRSVDARLEQISGRVDERLEQGFQKTHETFAHVMARLAVIDEAQKKIEGLTSNVVSLQQVLSDRSARGAFGEVQLEALVRDTLPPSVYAFQAALGEGRERADCVLTMPDGGSKLAIDSKFPLSNYRRAVDATLPEAERSAARRQFVTDVKRHVHDIASKYVRPEFGADSAVMFVPSEAVFAELVAQHPEVVEQAQRERVWVTSPTTLMAVLHSVRAVLRDAETRKQAALIKQELEKLARDFERFQERMDKLAQHIKQAHDDVDQVATSARKITGRFERIQAVEVRPLASQTAEASGRISAPVERSRDV